MWPKAVSTSPGSTAFSQIPAPATRGAAARHASHAAVEVLSDAALSHVLSVPSAARPDNVELRRHARRLIDLVLRAYR